MANQEKERWLKSINEPIPKPIIYQKELQIAEETVKKFRRWDGIQEGWKNFLEMPELRTHN